MNSNSLRGVDSNHHCRYFYALSLTVCANGARLWIGGALTIMLPLNVLREWGDSNPLTLNQYVTIKGNGFTDRRRYTPIICGLTQIRTGIVGVSDQ